MHAALAKARPPEDAARDAALASVISRIRGDAHDEEGDVPQIQRAGVPPAPAETDDVIVDTPATIHLEPTSVQGEQPGAKRGKKKAKTAGKKHDKKKHDKKKHASRKKEGRR